MNTVDVSSGTISLGQQGENLITQIRFPIAELVSQFGQGTFTLLNQRHGDLAPYIIETYQDSDFLYWDVTNIDTAFTGDGKCELQYSINGALKKSIVYVTLVGNSLWSGEPLPTPAPPPVLDPEHRAKPYPQLHPVPHKHGTWAVPYPPHTVNYNFVVTPDGGDLIINHSENLGAIRFQISSDGYLEVIF